VKNKPTKAKPVNRTPKALRRSANDWLNGANQKQSHVIRTMAAIKAYTPRVIFLVFIEG
jgi:hypothetical protein